MAPGCEALIARLDAAVEAASPDDIARQVKADLQSLLRTGGLTLPERFRQPRPDTYARRLLHRDPASRYTVVVMTWDAGQRTGLHDHAGIWCVECVVEGQMEVTQYDLAQANHGTFRFEQKSTVTAEVGSAGCLIPPFEYHTLANKLPDRPSITLHVYGGEMDRCHLFEPRGDGSYERRERALGYHE
jgi:3-mercaptopropionate dioxygenase